MKRSGSLLLEHLAALLVIAMALGLLTRNYFEYQRLVIDERREVLARYVAHVALDADIAPGEQKTITMAGEDYRVVMQKEGLVVSHNDKILYRFEAPGLHSD